MCRESDGAPNRAVPVSAQRGCVNREADLTPRINAGDGVVAAFPILSRASLITGTCCAD